MLPVGCVEGSIHPEATQLIFAMLSLAPLSLTGTPQELFNKKCKTGLCWLMLRHPLAMGKLARTGSKGVILVYLG